MERMQGRGGGKREERGRSIVKSGRKRKEEGGMLSNFLWRRKKGRGDRTGGVPQRGGRRKGEGTSRADTALAIGDPTDRGERGRPTANEEKEGRGRTGGPPAPPPVGVETGKEERGGGKGENLYDGFHDEGGGRKKKNLFFCAEPRCPNSCSCACWQRGKREKGG